MPSRRKSPNSGTKWGFYVCSRPGGAGRSWPAGSGGGSGRRCRGGVPARHCAGGVARLPVVQPAACADHRRPGRLPGRAGRHRLVVAARSIPATGPAGRAGFGIRVYRRDAGHAAGRHQAVSVRHLCRPAVPHRIPHPAHRHRRPARHDLHRTATVLPTGLVLDRRTRGGADRDAGLGDVRRGRSPRWPLRWPSRWCCGGG